MSKENIEQKLLNAIFGEEPTEGMKVRVKGGTPKAGESLCRTCRHASFRQGFKESDLTVLCNAGCYQAPYVLHDDIATCSDYDDKRVPSIRDLEKTAWILRTDKNGRQLGFRSPADRRKERLARGLKDYQEDDDGLIS